MEESWPKCVKHIFPGLLPCRPKGVSACSVVKSPPRLSSSIFTTEGGWKGVVPISQPRIPSRFGESVAQERDPPVDMPNPFGRHAPRRRGYIAHHHAIRSDTSRRCDFVPFVFALLSHSSVADATSASLPYGKPAVFGTTTGLNASILR